MKQYLLSRTDETIYITINNVKYQLVLFGNYPVKDFNYDQDLVKIFGGFYDLYDKIRYHIPNNTIVIQGYGKLTLIVYMKNLPTKMKMYKENMGIVEKIVT